MIKKVIIVIVWLIFLVSCKKHSVNQSVVAIENSDQSEINFIPDVRYSNIFDIKVIDGYKYVTVLNPWAEYDTMASYILYSKGKEKPLKLPKANFIIPVPIGSIATLSSSHIGFLELIDELDKVVGVTDGKHIYNSFLYKRFEQGEVVQIGWQMRNNLENIFNLFPELLMKTGIDHVRDEDTRLVEAGIAIAYNIEWMESSMLARAEWIKFVATFFNKDRVADSVFSQIEKKYNSVVALTKAVREKPKILSGKNFKGSWYMPGGKSYSAKLFLDAGGDFYFKKESSHGSIPLSFEIVLDNMVDADVWFIHRAESLHELEMMDERYKLFKAFKTGNVYTDAKRLNEFGGNDYWESGVARPDVILKDVIKILHPELLPDHELVYYRKLQ